MRLLQCIWAIARKDIQLEMRTRQVLATMIVFGLLGAVIFSFSFEMAPEQARRFLPGMLWVVTVFAAMFGLNRQFAVERVEGCLQGVLMAPMDRSALYFGKLLGNWLFVLAVVGVVWPAFFLFFRITGPLPLLQMLVVVILGSLGFVGAGTFLAALSAQTRAGEILLPILLLPVAVPLLIGGVKLTGGLMGGETLGAYDLWLKLILVYDLIFTIVPWLLFDSLVEG
ncbi:MAG: heme exporter protein CcmB [Bacillota bacterium]